MLSSFENTIQFVHTAGKKNSGTKNKKVKKIHEDNDEEELTEQERCEGMELVKRSLLHIHEDSNLKTELEKIITDMGVAGKSLTQLGLKLLHMISKPINHDIIPLCCNWSDEEMDKEHSKLKFAIIKYFLYINVMWARADRSKCPENEHCKLHYKWVTATITRLTKIKWKEVRNLFTCYIPLRIH